MARPELSSKNERRMQTFQKREAATKGAGSKAYAAKMNRQFDKQLKKKRTEVGLSTTAGKGEAMPKTGSTQRRRAAQAKAQKLITDDLRTANRYEDGENSINSDMNAIKQPKALMAAKKAKYEQQKKKRSTAPVGRRVGV